MKSPLYNGPRASVRALPIPLEKDNILVAKTHIYALRQLKAHISHAYPFLLSYSVADTSPLFQV